MMTIGELFTSVSTAVLALLMEPTTGKEKLAFPVEHSDSAYVKAGENESATKKDQKKDLRLGSSGGGEGASVKAIAKSGGSKKINKKEDISRASSTKAETTQPVRKASKEPAMPRRSLSSGKPQEENKLSSAGRHSMPQLQDSFESSPQESPQKQSSPTVSSSRFPKASPGSTDSGGGEIYSSEADTSGNDQSILNPTQREKIKSQIENLIESKPPATKVSSDSGVKSRAEKKNRPRQPQQQVNVLQNGGNQPPQQINSVPVNPHQNPPVSPQIQQVNQNAGNQPQPQQTNPVLQHVGNQHSPQVNPPPQQVNVPLLQQNIPLQPPQGYVMAPNVIQGEPLFIPPPLVNQPPQANNPVQQNMGNQQPPQGNPQGNQPQVQQINPMRQNVNAQPQVIQGIPQIAPNFQPPPPQNNPNGGNQPQVNPQQNQGNQPQNPPVNPPIQQVNPQGNQPQMNQPPQQVPPQGFMQAPNVIPGMPQFIPLPLAPQNPPVNQQQHNNPNMGNQQPQQINPVLVNPQQNPPVNPPQVQQINPMRQNVNAQPQVIQGIPQIAPNFQPLPPPQNNPNGGNQPQVNPQQNQGNQPQNPPVNPPIQQVNPQGNQPQMNQPPQQVPPQGFMQAPNVIPGMPQFIPLPLAPQNPPVNQQQHNNPNVGNQQPQQNNLNQPQPHINPPQNAPVNIPPPLDPILGGDMANFLQWLNQNIPPLPFGPQINPQQNQGNQPQFVPVSAQIHHIQQPIPNQIQEIQLNNPQQTPPVNPQIQPNVGDQEVLPPPPPPPPPPGDFTFAQGYVPRQRL